MTVSRRSLRVGACLSLSGRYARFGNQAARGLEAWQALDTNAELVLEDDQSDPHILEDAIKGVAARCDVLLGPYSTQLIRVAQRVAAEQGWLLWNHGGSGDDVEAAHPGHVVSVLTPTSRYAVPFLQRLSSDYAPCTLWVVQGKGSFGRQVAEGAEATAQQLGIDTRRIGSDGELSSVEVSSPWDLFCAGTFEGDVQTVKRAQDLRRSPRLVCAVAAGVRDFSDAVQNVNGVFGVGQWFPADGRTPKLGPTQAEFLSEYARLSGGVPDYPAVQAAAGAVLAAHCARQAGSVTRDLLWSAATELDTVTLFGGFRIDPTNGVQIKHKAVLVRWTSQGLVAASA